MAALQSKYSLHVKLLHPCCVLVCTVSLNPKHGTMPPARLVQFSCLLLDCDPLLPHNTVHILHVPQSVQVPESRKEKIRIDVRDGRLIEHDVMQSEIADVTVPI
jgi:hypothetical protein